MSVYLDIPSFLAFQAHAEDNLELKTIIDIPPPDVPLNRDNKKVIATVKLYSGGVLDGLYHVVEL
jgi:hypothetical protein